MLSPIFSGIVPARQSSSGSQPNEFVVEQSTGPEDDTVFTTTRVLR